jgi:hypothetical protein
VRAVLLAGSQLLTPWNRTLLENLIVARLVNKILAFRGPHYVSGPYPKPKESSSCLGILIPHDQY